MGFFQGQHCFVNIIKTLLIDFSVTTKNFDPVGVEHTSESGAYKLLASVIGKALFLRAHLSPNFFMQKTSTSTWVGSITSIQPSWLHFK